MGFFSKLVTKSTVRTVEKTLKTASDEKLVTHYNKLLEAQRLTDDPEELVMVGDLKQKIIDELNQRKSE